MSNISNKTLVLLSLSSMIALLGLFFFVNPQGKQIIFIFLPVLMIWVFLFSFLSLMIRVLLKNTSRLGEVIVFVISGLGVMLLLLSGIGQLTSGDIILTVFLAAVSTFYFYRSWA